MSEVTTVATPPADLAAELAALNDEFETAPAGKVVAWAMERFGGSLLVAASFQDVVLVDLAVAHDPNVPVVFLDTEAHFPRRWPSSRRFVTATGST